MADDKRVVLVTGASSGLGCAIALGLAEAGLRVYGASRRSEPGGASVEDVTPIRMDVRDDESVQAGLAQIVDRERRLDAVICNAGYGIAGALEDTSTSEAQAQFDTNFFGTHRVCRAALPHLRMRERAHVVVIGSISGLLGTPFQGMYSASKFALEGYCEALRIELRGGPVNVTLLEPGDFATGFTASRVRTVASGPGSRHSEAFERAMAIIAADEQGGADPQLVVQAVRETLESEAPPLRRIVASEQQAGLGDAKLKMPPEKLEASIARHYGLS